MPDRQDGTFLPQLALCSFVPGPVIDFADISSNQPPLLDTLPLPPLLRDLFHVHSLLLN
ncbi:MAG TPA: hypothetical protein VGP99_12605 [Tepidisphaeraceae bacterium]|nr:hypothetical protein [Tepidisphaeraceae bacterium]